jgi:hypothetical protein
LQQSGHFVKVLSASPLDNTPPFIPNPPDVGVIFIMTSRPQSENFFFISMVDFPGFISNIFLSVLIILFFRHKGTKALRKNNKIKTFVSSCLGGKYFLVQLVRVSNLRPLKQLRSLDYNAKL